MAEVRDLRYPAHAETLAGLKKTIDDCPAWAVNKFAVVFEGRMLSHAGAQRVYEARLAAEPTVPNVRRD